MLQQVTTYKAKKYHQKYQDIFPVTTQEIQEFFESIHQKYFFLWIFSSHFLWKGNLHTLWKPSQLSREVLAFAALILGVFVRSLRPQVRTTAALPLHSCTALQAIRQLLQGAGVAMHKARTLQYRESEKNAQALSSTTEITSER